jgi:hypothetical protein
MIMDKAGGYLFKSTIQQRDYGITIDTNGTHAPFTTAQLCAIMPDNWRTL